MCFIVTVIRNLGVGGLHEAEHLPILRIRGDADASTGRTAASRTGSMPATSTSSWGRARASIRSVSGSHSTGGPQGANGTDVEADGSGTLAEQRMYQLVRQQGPIVDLVFEIGGAEAFAFTFG